MVHSSNEEKWLKEKEMWQSNMDPYSLLDWKQTHCYQEQLGFRIEMMALQLKDHLQLEDLSLHCHFQSTEISSDKFDLPFNPS